MNKKDEIHYGSERYWDYDEQQTKLGNPFGVDLYHLKQLAIFWHMGAREEAIHDYFVRNTVYGSYLFVTGLERFLKYAKNLCFGEKEISAFKARYPVLASEGFQEYLWNFSFKGDVWAMPEGQIAFGQNEPIIKIRSDWLQGWFLETIVMSIMNSDISYATNAAHFVSAAEGRPVIDFGLRRAMGDGAKISASRAVYAGGVTATSNVAASFNLDIPASGTMSHEAIQYGVLRYGSEKEAFKAYIRQALALDEELSLLIDTFESVQGAKNAVGAMKEVGEEIGGTVHAKSFRIDSGDLYGEALKIRAIDPDKEWFEGIFLTNDLDPISIRDIAQKDASKKIITGFGAGTKLLNPPQVVGGVYKLSAIMIDDVWKPSMKTTNDRSKMTLPGDKEVYRYIDDDGNYENDVICLAGEIPTGNDRFPVLEKVMSEGEIIASASSLSQIQIRGRENLSKLSAVYKDYEGKERFPVMISPELEALQNEMIKDEERRRKEQTR